jgi:hypothetical protein
MGDLGTAISCANYTKFLGLTIQNDMAWHGDIQDIINKLNTACCIIRNVKQIVFMKTLKSVYFSYFHSVMAYGIMFCGNSSYAETVFKLQKSTIMALFLKKQIENRFQVF